MFLELIKSESENINRITDKLAQLKNRNERISYLRAKVINSLINKAFQLYKDNFDKILNGNLDMALLDIYQSENKYLQEIEAFSIKEIYNHRAVVEIDNAGYNVMYELLSHFVFPILKPKSGV